MNTHIVFSIEVEYFSEYQGFILSRNVWLNINSGLTLFNSSKYWKFDYFSLCFYLLGVSFRGTWVMRLGGLENGMLSIFYEKTQFDLMGIKKLLIKAKYNY